MPGQPVFTDLYELTMAASYFQNGHENDQATFDLFVRRMPKQRNYMVFAGLSEVVHFVESLQFDEAAIDYLRSLNLFTENFLSYLRGFRFSGQLESLNEGEIFFANEPIIKVTAPIIEAQIIETALINRVHLYSLLATKASRIVSAADGKNVIDFGARRSHGNDAAIAAAYTSYLVGALGTSNIEAGELFNIPVFGTMAHSFIQAFASEREAFVSYLKQYPKNSTLLIDTYDPLKAAHLVGRIANEESLPIQAVRIDSGNLGEVTNKVRNILDTYGLQKTQIFLSGDLDEYKITEFQQHNIPVDGFGVGTKMDVSSDAPYLEMVYKLSGIVQDGQFRHTRKNSPQKKNLPGQKQIYRQQGKDSAVEDIIGLENEKLSGTPLLHPVIQNGDLLLAPEPWELKRKNFHERLNDLPVEIRSVTSRYDYKVTVSEGITALL